ncbi:glycosyltransferase family 1 protein [Exilibacterium tricleocarpae]|uniref:Glycosyltransferase family 1 protein n=1 Tax=Exilibacterium tricleocarpae TaxID=2591008 RepID=A0A545SZ44_9GAMM|nr:alpha-glucan family phosphorylase [Exilibacterium tricleocarpae]TQV70199.1 glycosyltransferase family 1 protein [Exilibacterium tricleocarpae]
MEPSLFPLRELPPGLEDLALLATDLRWTWSHGGDALWETLDPQAWKLTENPYVVLQNISRERLQALAEDSEFQLRLRRLISARNAYCEQPGWVGETYPESPVRGIAYFSMEFGLGEALPLYAGGLGVLAGDYLKAASDLGLPLVGVGLLYQEGYFRQTVDTDGWQRETYHYNDPTSIPVRPVSGRDGAWMHVDIRLPCRDVRFRIWQAQVGRVSLYLLDSNDPLNQPGDRGITSKLYGGGQEQRLVQEIALGICGWRLIDALGLEVDTCHLNEGHAAFATIERTRRYMEKTGLDFWEALWATRIGNVFTTHTPVAAGFDRYDTDLLLRYSREYAESLGVEPAALGALGRKDPDDHDEPFNMAYLAMRTCGRSNGVSRLHGEVSRRIFADLYPRWPRAQVPVTHITNGIHVPSWDSPWADAEWTQMAGKERWRSDIAGLDTSVLENVSDAALWVVNGRERADLVDYARTRLARQLAQHDSGEDFSVVSAQILDPNVLTLGFARRFAAYKRPDLLLHDIERFTRLLTNPERPVQIIVAGKAHPADEAGKRAIQRWLQFVQRPAVRAHAVFLEDYDIALAQQLVQGVDVWINTPRRPWEACGTSGMKVLVNGGLNVSSLDGWWAEAYSPEVGWALGDGSEHDGPDDRRRADAADAERLYELLEQEVVPLFYERDSGGVPRRWIQRMRTSMSSLTPQYSTNRMVREYMENLYMPAAAGLAARTRERGKLARELRRWSRQLERHWHEVHIGDVYTRQTPDGWIFQVPVYLGGVAPDAVDVQLFADAPAPAQQPFCVSMQNRANIEGALNSYLYTLAVETRRPAVDFTSRVVAYHAAAQVPAESALIVWHSGEVNIQSIQTETSEDATVGSEPC